MERPANGLWLALRRVAKPERPLDLMLAVWPLMVGRRFATHTRPVAWNKGRVDVEVTNPDWRQELEGLSKSVRSQINRWWGTPLVREVRFLPAWRRTARRARKPAAHPSAKRAGDHAAAGGPRSVSQAPPALGSAETKLSTALRQLEPVLSGIADEELRDLIGRVAAKYLAKPGKK